MQPAPSSTDRYRFDDTRLAEPYRSALRLDSPVPGNAKYVAWLPRTNLVPRFFTGIFAVCAVGFTVLDLAHQRRIASTPG